MAGREVIILLVAALFIQLAVYAVQGGKQGYNIGLWEESGKIADGHGLLAVYRVEAGMPQKFFAGYFAFPPPWLLITYGTYKAAMGFALDPAGFAYMIRILPFLASLANILLVFEILREKKGEKTAAAGAFLYATVFAVVDWFTLYENGQMDAIPVFFTLLALALAEKEKTKWAMLSLGVGASFKLYPLAIAGALILREWGKRRDVRGLARNLMLCGVPLLIFSLPYLASDAGAYFEALSRYVSWAGSASIYSWIYALLGIPAYLARNPPLSEFQSTAVLTTTLVSLFLTIGALGLGYRKALRENTPLLLAMLLPLLAMLAFWKFVDVNFATWVLPFCVMDAVENELLVGSKAYLFVMFWLAFVGVFAFFPLLQLASIVYYAEAVRRK